MSPSQGSRNGPAETARGFFSGLAGNSRSGTASRWCASPRLPGRRTGREAGLSTRSESLGCHRVPLILLPRKKGEKHVFPGPNPLHMGGHHREPGPCCRHAGRQEHCCHSTRGPLPLTCRFLTAEALAYPCLPFRASTLPTSYPQPALRLARPHRLQLKGKQGSTS